MNRTACILPVPIHRGCIGGLPLQKSTQCEYRKIHRIRILAEAITNAGSTDAATIRDAMANITDFDTVLGQFSFNDVGDAVYDPAILIVQDGAFGVLE